MLHLFPLGEHETERHFGQLPVLEHFFRQPEQQHHQFVISSTWRNQYTLTELQQHFSPDFRARIVGVTPNLADYSKGNREREILHYLQAHGGIEQAWLALDDMPEFFQYHQQHVLFTTPDTGLTGADYPDLMQKLAEIEQRFQAS
ncbi:HAD domain-containing protein [Neisseriaceae bacterium B1]